jgi:hypothetical protein
MDAWLKRNGKTRADIPSILAPGSISCKSASSRNSSRVLGPCTKPWFASISAQATNFFQLALLIPDSNGSEKLARSAADDAAAASPPPPSDPRDAQSNPFADPQFTPVGLVARNL